MQSFEANAKFGELVEGEIERLRRVPRWLRFSPALEVKFEADTAKERSHRLWLEGLIAIAVLNACLLADWIFIQDSLLSTVLKQTLMVTPIALFVNCMMLLNLRAWAREGAVAAGMTVICCINLYVEGGSTAATAMFGLMSVLITLLFVNVVMRLRLPYAVMATLLMTAGGIEFAANAGGLKPQEQLVGASLLFLGAAITLTAAYSLERQERLSYLLFMSSEMQSAELHRLSNLDRLTDLPNRRAFDERFELLWSQGIQAKTQLSMILVDIDHFKVVNDVYGHLYGDEVLRRVAALLPAALYGSLDMAARFGGEEFVILLANTSRKVATEVADRLRQMVEKSGTPLVSNNGESVLKVTVSCGVSSCVPDPGLRQEKLLKAADRGLYKSKEGGRNQVTYCVCELAAVFAADSGSPARSSTIRRLAKVRASNRFR
jgi:diguanylate cyclase (GGDEF)-like protein